ncbi:hypothetical protein [Ruminococcus bicirculans (ex Wegman et al. 2014)]|uniref:hypothetical protein n=1 Tax=Ruminococcus bicirculans (ex Wegman et al. 2014) TaxID=1160721 RepID=UPI0022E5D252|nr:hypothetical protein [Ruminococcus bicirculans (ex Wegman et al. 2014)]
MILNSGDEVRIRRFKDLCCEYSFYINVYNDVYENGIQEDYIRNLNGQGILGGSMDILCGKIVKINNSIRSGYWKLSEENQCPKRLITDKAWHEDLFEEPSKLRGIDNVDET